MRALVKFSLSLAVLIIPAQCVMAQSSGAYPVFAVAYEVGTFGWDCTTTLYSDGTIATSTPGTDPPNSNVNDHLQGGDATGLLGSMPPFEGEPVDIGDFDGEPEAIAGVGEAIKDFVSDAVITGAAATAMYLLLSIF